MKDYYKILGIERSATQADIKQAYRRMAMEHHPDRGGNVAQFQDIQEAYSVLGDEEKRRQYDNPNPHVNINFGGGHGSAFDINSIFEMFGADLRKQQRQVNPRVSIGISLADVMNGGPRTLNIRLDNASTMVEIDIPKGVRDNDNIRYPGLAPGGHDLIVNYRVMPDPVWQREANNLITVQRVSIWDLIAGGEVSIVDPAGNRYELQIQPETQPNTTLRLKNKGLPPRQLPTDRSHGIAGDLLVKLEAVIPTPVDPQILAAVKQFKQK